MKKIITLLATMLLMICLVACGNVQETEEKEPMARKITSTIYSAMINGDIDTLYMNFYQPYDDFDVYEFEEYFYNTDLGSFIGIELVELGTKFETCNDGTVRVVISTTEGDIIFFLIKDGDTYKFFVDEIYTKCKVKIPKGVSFSINDVTVNEKPVNTITDEIGSWDVYNLHFLCHGLHNITLNTAVGEIKTTIAVRDIDEVNTLDLSKEFVGAYEVDTLIKESHNQFQTLAFTKESDYTGIKDMCTDSINENMLKTFVQEIIDEADLTMNRWSRKYKNINITNINYTLIEALSYDTFYIEFDVTKTYKENGVDGEYTGKANIVVKYDGSNWKIEQISNKTLYTTVSSINTFKPLTLDNAGLGEISND